MEKVYLIIFSFLFSAIIGMVGWWIKTVHKEVKELIKELTELKQLLAGMKMQVEKSIETDITEMKSDIKTLFRRTNKNESSIATLKQKTGVK
jgi:predicted RNase H-like nuclease (RuvC/YqgF family)